MNLINIWYTISNSKQRHTANAFGNAIIVNDKKADIYRTFADWIELQYASPTFKLTFQRKSALVTTLRAHVDLIEKLIDDRYEFIRTARFQSDTIEMRFSQYQWMGIGRSLVILREVFNSEMFLSCWSLIEENINFWGKSCWSLIKDNINFWEENADSDSEKTLDSINDLFDETADEIIEAILDDDARDVSTTISGSVATNPIKRNSRDLCKHLTLASQEVDLENNSYLKLLSSGGLFVPSRELADFVYDCFVILCSLEKEIVLLGMSIAKVVNCTLTHFSCNMHHDWSFKFASIIVVYVFFNNKQKKLGFG